MHAAPARLSAALTVTSALTLLSASAIAAPVVYDVDPSHTYPSFEADHFGGLSIWRGKFTKSSGKITLDREKATGTVTITVDASSIDFGHQALNERARSSDMFDVQKYPAAVFEGTLTGFKDGAPSEVHGQLTLHGITKPLTLTITQFKCMNNPVVHKEVCGADASTTFDRSAFGINFGADYGFKQQVKLQIEVEAMKSG